MTPGKDINEVTKSYNDAMDSLETAQAENHVRLADLPGADADETASQIPPTGDISKITAPINANLTFEDRMRERYEKELEAERLKEQKRLDLERLGHGIADLSAQIGDIVRAHEGAPVNPRDWQQIYDNLTAQEKANMDNYRVRMAKLREDARADRKAAAQVAAKAEADKQQREHDDWKWAKELYWKSDEAARKEMLDWMIANLRADTQVTVSKNRGSGSTPKPVRFTAFGKSYDVIGDTKSFTNMMNEILRVINDKNNTADGKEYKAISYKPEEIRTDPQGFYNRRVKELIGPESVGQYKPEAISEIEGIINAYKFGSEPGAEFGNNEKPVRQ